MIYYFELLPSAPAIEIMINLNAILIVVVKPSCADSTAVVRFK